MAAKIPRIERGDPIRASYLNEIGAAINGKPFDAPRDLDGGLETPEEESIDGSEPSLLPIEFLAEVRRLSIDKRIYQDGDATSENYVDVARATVSMLFDVGTGEGKMIYWLNE